MTGRPASRPDRAAHGWTLVAPWYDHAVAAVGWHRWQEELVSDVTSGRLLDVGCGPGHLARDLMARGVDYVGVDRNAAMVSRAGRRVKAGPGRGLVMRADVTALPFCAASFDVVVSSGLLGLLDIDVRRAALRELARVARTEVRLLEPVHRPDAPRRTIRSRLVALVRDRPIELAELVDAGLDPELHGPAHLGGVYSRVDATKRG